MSAIQQKFAQDAARLILKAAELGYGVTLGDAYRLPEQAKTNAASGSGIAKSLHCERLAIDLNLFKDGGLEGIRKCRNPRRGRARWLDDYRIRAPVLGA